MNKKHSSLTKHKRSLKQSLLDDARRRGVNRCEGQWYLGHVCRGPIEVNEVIIPKSVFQKIAKRKHKYFYHEYNSSLNCRWFHAEHGHSKKFRRWFMEYVSATYGGLEVADWLAQAPLKIKRGI